MRTAALLALCLLTPFSSQCPWPPDRWHALLLGCLGLLWWGVRLCEKGVVSV